ncbi:hypothetical protein [Oleiharenicola sp. Vm1]|uniref:hypothetical protein n=1 Tax=Oleiharenicola sp. Vm1 TaxID=3398393 RepID=UPI0039F5FD00
MDQKNSAITEAMIEEIIARHFNSLPEGQAMQQCPVYERRVDVLALSGAELWAIEAKLSDWRRAVQQAFINLPASDRSFIAIWEPNVGRVDLAVLDHYSVGLISVGTSPATCAIVHMPSESPHRNSIMIDRLKARFATEGAKLRDAGKLAGAPSAKPPLFIPLKRAFFDAFERGAKTTEYRIYGPRWNESTCPVGRPVVLSLGYGKAHRLHGTIRSFTRMKRPEKLPGWIECYGAGEGRVAACIEINVSREPLGHPL